MNKKSLPTEVSSIGQTLQDAGFEAYIVGGCIRDILLNNEPKDWDITTNAQPEEIQSLFPHSHYDNTYGTVRVVNDITEDPRLKVIEITTYRTESAYSDKRRPDHVRFSSSLEEDLQRRDFTINALAHPVSRETYVTPETTIDLYGGITDLREGVVRTVGDPHERFSEDALRLMRAVRFAAQLGFMINTETLAAITTQAEALKMIAVERIQEEFNKVLMSNSPIVGLELMQRTGLLSTFLPELEKGIGMEQNQAHSFTVWEHLLRTLQASADKGWGLSMRLAALFHDIGKPYTREWSKEKGDWTFHGHEVVGSRVTKAILERLKYSREIQEEVLILVRWHMFFSDPETITLSAVRRLINRVGKERIWDLVNIRIADRIGTGRPKEKPYRLRKFQSMVEEALRDPVSVGMLKINGDKIMKEFQVNPGPIIGYILHALLDEVLEEPRLNTEMFLMKRTEELLNLPEKELEALGKAGKERQKEEEQTELDEIRNKYKVK